MCSVPFASLFRAASAVAFSGLRHVATTRFDGDWTSCLTSSKPSPREVLRKTSHICQPGLTRIEVRTHPVMNQEV